MRPAQIIRTLNLIRKLYRDILDDTAPHIIEDAIQNVNATRRHYDLQRKRSKETDATWGYEISHEQPLKFRSSSVMSGILPFIDIYCNIQWREDALPVKQDIKTRIWSDAEGMRYRGDFDSEWILDKLTTPERTHRGRVITRLHFDKASTPPNTSQQYHPTFHLQVGGKPHEYELCWHPGSFDLPRLGYQPMELFLTCQLIAINFFPQEYSEIRKELEWIGELRVYQENMLITYYENCIKTINDRKSLFDSLDIRNSL